MPADPYHLLGLSRGASDAEIKAAFRHLAKECHPDLHGGDPHMTARFEAISDAYAMLGNAASRAAYDRAHARPTEPPPQAHGRSREPPHPAHPVPHADIHYYAGYNASPPSQRQPFPGQPSAPAFDPMNDPQAQRLMAEAEMLDLFGTPGSYRYRNNLDGVVLYEIGQFLGENVLTVIVGLICLLPVGLGVYIVGHALHFF